MAAAPDSEMAAAFLALCGAQQDELMRPASAGRDAQPQFPGTLSRVRKAQHTPGDRAKKAPQAAGRSQESQAIVPASQAIVPASQAIVPVSQAIVPVAEAPVFKRKEAPAMSWRDKWRVRVDEYTRYCSTDFDGTSAHPAARVEPRRLFPGLPQDFGIGVVIGASGSGKTQILLELAQRWGMKTGSTIGDVPVGPESFPKDMAVCSHPGFRGRVSDRMGCVGLNRVPAWLRPLGQLSSGERSRVLMALRIRTGCVLDDFATDTDSTHAASMAVALAKLVAREQLRKVLVGTTKTDILRHLQPDFVVFACSGKVYMNPLPFEERHPTVSFDFSGIRGFGTGSNGDWEGQADAGPPLGPSDRRREGELGSGPRRTPCWFKAEGVRTLNSEVKNDNASQDVAEAFEYDFDGHTETRLPCLEKHSALFLAKARLAALVGPSGCGKTTELQRLSGLNSQATVVGRHGRRDLGEQRPLFWDNSRSVISHFREDGASPSQALKLLQAAALPLACCLRPYRVLSSGEKARAEIARRLVTGGSIDEFTSGLDRATARRVCMGVGRHARGHVLPRPILVATVHEDVVRWLLPDFALYVESGDVLAFMGEPVTPEDVEAAAASARSVRSPELSDEAAQISFEGKVAVRRLLEPPRLQLTARPVPGKLAQEWWDHAFHQHNYLTKTLNTASRSLLLRMGEEPVAIHSVLAQPGRGSSGLTYTEHQLVVLPQFQGWGIGPRFSQEVGSRLLQAGRRFISSTAHPRLRDARRAQPSLWKEANYGGNPQEAHSSGQPQTRSFTAAPELEGNMLALAVVPSAKRGVGRLKGSAQAQAQKEPERRVCHFQFMGEVDGNNHLVAPLKKGLKRRSKPEEEDPLARPPKRLRQKTRDEPEGKAPARMLALPPPSAAAAVPSKRSLTLPPSADVAAPLRGLLLPASPAVTAPIVTRAALPTGARARRASTPKRMLALPPSGAAVGSTHALALPAPAAPPLRQRARTAPRPRWRAGALRRPRPQRAAAAAAAAGRAAAAAAGRAASAAERQASRGRKGAPLALEDRGGSAAAAAAPSGRKRSPAPRRAEAPRQATARSLPPKPAPPASGTVGNLDAAWAWSLRPHGERAWDCSDPEMVKCPVCGMQVEAKRKALLETLACPRVRLAEDPDRQKAQVVLLQRVFLASTRQERLKAVRNFDASLLTAQHDDMVASAAQQMLAKRPADN